ncbi:MAG TPA: hypothetical protein ENK06_11260 [Gammaproteobacteria bacterium]|nr:hypothetical protein [Gammaproteobacteria bacterium]
MFHNLQAVEVNESERKTFSDDLLTLGTEESKYGGEDFMKFDRGEIRSQIKALIPPLLRPAFTQHAFVLPPSTTSISISQRFVDVNGDDFFKGGEPNTAVFNNFTVARQLTDLDIFRGFDFNTKYLHGFTFRLNVPYLSTQTNGSVNPGGQQFINLENAGSSQSLGDIGLFLKKKILDQGNSPFGLAIAAAVFLPTGKNDETYGSNGRISATRPQVPPPIASGNPDGALALAQGFDAYQAKLVEQGTWGDARCFFSNFNTANHDTLCNGNPSFGVPASAAQSFSPGGANEDNLLTGDFPFNEGVFGRFSSDGRLPSNLQPGTGKTSFMVAAFITRQFHPGSLIGRAAFHAGFNHHFISASDGIDPGDITTVFASFVKPVYKDYLAVDLTFVGVNEQADSYAGKIPEPGVHTCSAADVGVVGGCSAEGDKAFQFEVQDRPAFLKGFMGFAAPSLIFSPDPQMRATLSALIRVVDPDLGPAPNSIIRAAVEYTF